MKKIKRKSRRMTPPMLASKYSGSEILKPTAANFPALKNFWDKNNIVGAELRDTIGSQHVISSEGHWYEGEEGFAKWTIPGGNYTPEQFEAPANRDFMLIGCGRISMATRECTIGDSANVGAGVSFGTAYPANHIASAQIDFDNKTLAGEYSFSDELPDSWSIDENGNVHPNDSVDSDNVGIWGCWATVVSPSAGTCIGRWAGRNSDTAGYNVPYEEVVYPVTGSIQQSWPKLGTPGIDGTLWTMFPGNRFEWVGLLYFESGAPTDMQAAMEWMAQHDDIRMYPGWKGKQ